MPAKGNEKEINCKEQDIHPDCKKISNIRYSGPGLWIAMHFMAARCKDEADKITLVKYIRMLTENMGCVWCRQHAKEYINEHPLRASWDNLFKWTVVFHNAVNERLKKPIMSLDDAAKIYMGNSEVCTAECDESIVPVTFEKNADNPKITFSSSNKKKPPTFRIIST
jgi:hypothetical protein